MHTGNYFGKKISNLSKGVLIGLKFGYGCLSSLSQEMANKQIQLVYHKYDLTTKYFVDVTGIV